MILKSNIKNIELIKVVLTDLDGTLTRWTCSVSLLKAVFAHYNTAYKDEYFIQWIKIFKDVENYSLLNGINSIEYYGESFEKHMPILKESKINAIHFANKSIELEPDFIFTNDDILPTLENLASYYRFICITNWFMKSAIAKLQKYNFDLYVEKIYNFETNYAKPNKLAIEKILIEQSLNPENVVIIGDTVTDLKAAKAAGVNSILVDYDMCNYNLHDEAGAVITDFGDLNSILLKNNKQIKLRK